MKEPPYNKIQKMVFLCNFINSQTIAAQKIFTDLQKVLNIDLFTIPLLFPYIQKDTFLYDTNKEFEIKDFTLPTPELIEEVKKEVKKYTQKQKILVKLYFLASQSNFVVNNIIANETIKHFKDLYFEDIEYNYFRKIIKDFAEIHNAKDNKQPAKPQILKLKDFKEIIEYYEKIKDYNILEIIKKDISKVKKSLKE